MWSIETLNDTVEAELEALPIDMRARFGRICDLIESVGLTNVGEPYVKQLDGKIWEMRMSGKSGISRAIILLRKCVGLYYFVSLSKRPRRHRKKKLT